MSGPPAERDLAVVGGGILGLAVARELVSRHPGRSAVVLERADRVAGGQTGANSGVIHAGIYYKPGSLKARMCVAGARAMYAYCEELGIPFERCGKVIVARTEDELPRLDELERRGRENEVGLRRLTADELQEIEPHCRVAALHSPATGIVDFGRRSGAGRRARGTRRAGGHRLRHPGRGLASGPRRPSARPRETRARFAVFCAGAGSDRLAVAAGAARPADRVPAGPTSTCAPSGANSCAR